MQTCKGSSLRSGEPVIGTVLVVVLGALWGCGDSDSPTVSAAQGSYPKIELKIPPRLNDDPGLPDSCELLVAGDPQSMIDEELTALERMSDLCLVAAKSTPTLERSITVEVRRPEQIELERGGVPTNEEEFWVHEGGGVDLVGGKREQIEELAGIGDYSLWYPIKDGMALHAYWNNAYIVAINIRGVDMERSLAWAQETAKKAIAQAQASNQDGPAAATEPSGQDAGSSASEASPAPGSSSAEGNEASGEGSSDSEG